MPAVDSTTILVTRPAAHVAHVELARPEKRNAMNSAFWRECRLIFDALSGDADVRAIVVSGSGRCFSSGLDLSEDPGLIGGDPGHVMFRMRAKILSMQDGFNAIERCPQPVLVCCHGASIGGAVDMICACDVRWCTNDAYFCVKEVDLALAADVGTLQRLPKVIGSQSLVNDLCFTARALKAGEALAAGLVSRTFTSKDHMMESALQFAASVASKSPLAVAGTKRALLYARDHSVADSLEQVATWNAGALQAEDLGEAKAAAAERRQPVYSRL